MKAIILSRVSTIEQQDGHSIDAQKARLKEYCERKGFRIIKEFEIIESSTKGSRKAFYDMLEFAKKQKETIAIVADAVDRIQRSFKESTILDELVRQEKIELHFYRESMVIGKDAKSSDIMRWDFSVMGAKTYVLNISDNVKRSIEYKIRNGEYIRRAPVGYLNIKDPITGKSDIIVDKERAYLIKKIFEEYATGLSSFNQLAKQSKKWGLRNNTKTAKYLSHSVISNLLSDPFYYGYMRIYGDIHKHKYEPLISKELFDRCQEIRNGYKKKPFRDSKKDFIFKGLIKCGVSDRLVSCDIKKGKYVYLICRDPKNPDKKLFVKEGVILDQIKEVFKSLQVPEDLLKLLQKHLEESAGSERKFHQLQIKSLEKESSLVQSKLDNLLDMRLSSSITQDEYDKKAIELRQRQKELNAELSLHNQADEKFSVTLTSLISLASKAYDIFESSKIAEKRKLINFMFSNLKIKAEKLEYDLNKPFDLMVNKATYQEWLSV